MTLNVADVLVDACRLRRLERKGMREVNTRGRIQVVTWEQESAAGKQEILSGATIQCCNEAWYHVSCCDGEIMRTSRNPNNNIGGQMRILLQGEDSLSNKRMILCAVPARPHPDAVTARNFLLMYKGLRNVCDLALPF